MKLGEIVRKIDEYVGLSQKKLSAVIKKAFL